jgi:hypothetical protein
MNETHIPFSLLIRPGHGGDQLAAWGEEPEKNAFAARLRRDRVPRRHLHLIRDAPPAKVLAILGFTTQTQVDIPTSSPR